MAKQQKRTKKKKAELVDSEQLNFSRILYRIREKITNIAAMKYGGDAYVFDWITPLSSMSLSSTYANKWPSTDERN